MQEKVNPAFNTTELFVEMVFELNSIDQRIAAGYAENQFKLFHQLLLVGP